METLTTRDPACVAHWADRLARLDGRRLTVYVDTTNDCNLRCRMCHFSLPEFSRREPRRMTPEQFERIGRELFGAARTMYLSAACEPLTHPRFREILAVASRSGVPDLRVLTNGVLLTPELAEALLSSGLSSLQVSVDGVRAATYERIRRGARFERLVSALRLLAERKRRIGGSTQVQLNVTLMRANLDELPEFADFAREHGADAIACRHLMPYARLGLAGETLDAEPERANEVFARFLDRASELGVLVTEFPDFFRVGGRSWLPPLRGRFPIRSDPFGCVDVPGEPTIVTPGPVLLSGWALDRKRVDRVDVFRRGPGDDGPFALGEAKLVNAARPDVARVHAYVPHSWRAGWRFETDLSELATPRRAETLEIDVVARSATGGATLIGTRRIVLDPQRRQPPRPACAKPFDCVYVDALGDVVPSPDCQNWTSLGRLGPSLTFQGIWGSPAWRDIRSRILGGDPPRSCGRCPAYINRNVDDPAYFAERDVLEGGPD